MHLAGRTPVCCVLWRDKAGGDSVGFRVSPKWPKRDRTLGGVIKGVSVPLRDASGILEMDHKVTPWLPYLDVN